MRVQGQDYSSTLDEKELLDEIEAGTKRIALLSRNIGESSKQSVALMSDIETGISQSKRSLQQEAHHINAAREASGGNCYLYMLIALELVSLLTLLDYGLS